MMGAAAASSPTTRTAYGSTFTCIMWASPGRPHRATPRPVCHRRPSPVCLGPIVYSQTENRTTFKTRSLSTPGVTGRAVLRSKGQGHLGWKTEGLSGPKLLVSGTQHHSAISETHCSIMSHGAGVAEPDRRTDYQWAFGQRGYGFCGVTRDIVAIVEGVIAPPED